jgi:hypothetical protein
MRIYPFLLVLGLAVAAAVPAPAAAQGTLVTILNNAPVPAEGLFFGPVNIGSHPRLSVLGNVAGPSALRVFFQFAEAHVAFATGPSAGAKSIQVSCIVGSMEVSGCSSPPFTGTSVPVLGPYLVGHVQGGSGSEVITLKVWASH